MKEQAVVLGVISDTHGNMNAIKKAVKCCGKADLWLHAGDYCRDAALVTKLTGSKVFSVCGNCDSINSSADVDEFINIGSRKIWLTHGHKYEVKHNPRELVFWAKQYEADIVIYGHILMLLILPGPKMSCYLIRGVRHILAVRYQPAANWRLERMG